ncbi:conserved hypothetical protein [Talaromyces stipitatus ATCC 10500]|uniref:Glyceraldehyde 3-phosphate dehydrogenase n=1 Tax=Talaromyces stipitatus (strain ATCC 10500 / CBS 375.48 / QM 6759 / NRRL 1006) TaxID=441959 RepID=B8M3E4_TALSN|nr:uncharacterized protein TSTA_095650 [Talaromyces stipitatus ATCC 10500]EED22316.1 conserved hypothetical protein [Talaromyces stipitatus ATCC 10500]
MSGFRGVMKDGWHPKGKEGGKESWRGDFKGINQVAGWMGKGKDSSKDDRAEHVSRPLSSLKDPATFGPPPKRGDSRTSTTSVSKSTTASRGLGSELAAEEITHEPEQVEEPAPPPLPYRANRTGINIEHLPPPPVRRTESPANSTHAPASQPRPHLPPRLPTRNTTTSPSPPPPPYSEADRSIEMNQGSVSRLEQAGVSVPALGIGRRDSDQSATVQRGMNNQVNELQTRFAKMSTPGSQTPQSLQSPIPIERPTSQRGFDSNTSTASRTDTRPSPLPSTTSTFRQRSNEHIETGKQKLAAFNQKHRITERINSYFEEQPPLKASQGAPQPPPPPPHPNLSRQSSNIDIEVLNKRKPPPPPPPAKKPNLKSTPVNGGAESPSPPPLPLGTKPR